MIKKILMTGLMSIIAINAAHAAGAAEVKAGEGAPVIHTEDELRQAEKGTVSVSPERTIEGAALIAPEARDTASSLRAAIQHNSTPVDLLKVVAHVVRSYRLAERSGIKSDYVSAQMAAEKTVLANLGLIASKLSPNATADKEAVTAVLSIGDKIAEGSMSVDEMNSFANVIMAMGDKLRSRASDHSYDSIAALHEALSELYGPNWHEKLDKLLKCIV